MCGKQHGPNDRVTWCQALYVFVHSPVLDPIGPHRTVCPTAQYLGPVGPAENGAYLKVVSPCRISALNITS